MELYRDYNSRARVFLHYSSNVYRSPTQLDDYPRQTAPHSVSWHVPMYETLDDKSQSLANITRSLFSRHPSFPSPINWPIIISIIIPQKKIHLKRIFRERKGERKVYLRITRINNRHVGRISGEKTHVVFGEWKRRRKPDNRPYAYHPPRWYPQ